MESSIDEVRRLRSCINNLVSLVALPAIWSGREPRHVVESLLGALVRILRLDFAYARLTRGDHPALELVQTGPGGQNPPRPREVGRALEPWLSDGTLSPTRRAANPIGSGQVSMALVWLGLDREMGVVVAGCSRSGFPTDVEPLLLRVAVNQAVIELQAGQVRRARARAEEIERKQDSLQAENVYLQQELDGAENGESTLFECTGLKKVLKLVERVAPTTACVLILGETGTGKELVARSVHRLSTRKERRFVKLNCAAIPTGLLEAELFGHEKGAFTGAVAQRTGRFEVAHRGTFFLDEVGEIPLELQTKLLRVLQEQEFERLGSTKTIRVDVRLIAATNRDLPRMVADGQFRSDLYYRLNVFPIPVPPLRERVEDIPVLVRHFVARYAGRFCKSIESIPAASMNALTRYAWPGNVRELENMIERSVILSQGATLEVPLGELSASLPKTQGLRTLDEIERDHILRTLNQTDWVVAGPKGAAVKLGMKRSSLQYRMQKLGIQRPP
jgi:formate hydrogenlyase transcriptional activator